uniref:Uncharacterized protein n=1 Tax=viral metagenome TaxID=1070528 RepID=A0A6M3IV84_9ZZZZ
MKERLHLRGELIGGHTRITVFCNGANCGQLTMSEKEAIYFHHVVTMSVYARPSEVITSGTWDTEDKE